MAINKAKVVVLGTAHEEGTPGKCSPDGKFREQLYSRSVIPEIKAKLEALGYTVFIDYLPSAPLPEWKRARIAGGWKGEQNAELAYRVNFVNSICRKYGTGNVVYVSIHNDAAGGDGKWHDAGGWSAWTTRGNTKADKLAECLCSAAERNLAEYAKMMEEGKKTGVYGKKQRPFRFDYSDGDKDSEANYYVLAKTNCPAVLTENLFQDSKADVQFLLSDEGRHAIERLHVEGIANYFESL